MEVDEAVDELIDEGFEDSRGDGCTQGLGVVVYDLLWGQLRKERKFVKYYTD